MHETPMFGWPAWMLAASCLASSGCGGVDTRAARDRPAIPDDDAATDASQAVAPPAGNEAGDGASGVRVGIAVVGQGATADTAFVAVVLRVADRTTGAPVLDASVTGGPVGHALPLLADPSDPGAYDAQRTGYSAAWEFAVTREGRQVWKAVVTGPSFPAATYVIDWYTNPPALTVNWTPSHEAGVASAATVLRTYPAPPPYQSPPRWVIDGHDEGTARPFLLSPSTNDRYWVDVDLTTSATFDWGQATIGITGIAQPARCG